MLILVTGGAGYIGSHTIIELLTAGYEVVVIDNLSNSSSLVFDRIELITGVRPQFVQGDICDDGILEKTFQSYKIDSVVHFAGLKSVNESISSPLEYYKNNVQGTLSLLSVMARHNVRSLVFSSSAAVYGDSKTLPLNEKCRLESQANPYGESKAMAEQILDALSASDSGWSICKLRYFNPVGAHRSGLIGEDPKGEPGNLMPHVVRAASFAGVKISVFGCDYDTPDGTGVRDYIHMVDLAEGHVKALQLCAKSDGVYTINLGTGKGHSVLELITTFIEVSGKSIQYDVVGRRKGDVAMCYADVSLAKKVLGWEAKRGLRDMCEDSWRWAILNPYGYDKK